MEINNVKAAFNTALQNIAQFFSSLAARISAFVKSIFAKKAEQPTSTPAPVVGRDIKVETEEKKDTVPTPVATPLLALPAPEPEAKPNLSKLAEFQRKSAEKAKKPEEKGDAPVPVRRSTRTRKAPKRLSL